MKTLLIILSFYLIFPGISIAEKKDKVIYKYKQYQRFDLGNLEIKGSLIAPGDLSVKERDRKLFKSKIFKRKNFFKEIERDVNELR